jgi:hypothetical protein
MRDLSDLEDGWESARRIEIDHRVFQLVWVVTREFWLTAWPVAAFPQSFVQ